MIKKKVRKTVKLSHSKVPKWKNKKAKKPAITTHHESLKEGIMSVNNKEADYDKMFEQKLAESYRMFRDLKEHRIQIKRLGGILVFILIMILAALLLLTFS